MIDISIIIPVYNTGNYIEKCIKSLIRQKSKNLEFLFINDGSTDNSLDILNKYASLDKRVKVFDKKNEGVSVARNFGISKAKGKYLCFVDSDDYVSDNYCERFLEAIENSNSDMVICNYYEINEFNDFKKEIKVMDFNAGNLNENKELLFNLNYAPWNKIYKKDLFSSVKFPSYKYEDVGTIGIIIEKCKKISKINDYLYYYLIRGSGETGVVDKKSLEIINILEILRNYYSDKPEYKEQLDFLTIQKIYIYIVKQRFQKDLKTAVNNVKILKDYLYKNNIIARKNIYYNKNINIKQKIICGFDFVFFPVYFMYKKIRGLIFK